MHFITFYIALTTAVAGIAAFPVDTTIDQSLHRRAIPSYNNGQAVFAREKGQATTGKQKTKGSNKVSTAQQGSTGSSSGARAKAVVSCPKLKSPLNKLPPPNTKITGGKTTVNSGGTKSNKGGKPTSQQKRSLYRRAAETFTQDPTKGGLRLGGGNWADVFVDPTNDKLVIKKFKPGSTDADDIKDEIASYTLVGQYANRYGHMGTGFNQIFFLYMHRIPGMSMGQSPLWLSYKGTKDEEVAKQVIQCAIKQKLAFYANKGIRHPDLFQDNTILSGPNLENLVVDFVDWNGMKIQNPFVPPTDKELDAWTKKAMEPKSW